MRSVEERRRRSSREKRDGHERGGRRSADEDRERGETRAAEKSSHVVRAGSETRYGGMSPRVRPHGLGLRPSMFSGFQGFGGLSAGRRTLMGLVLV
jgi:hypothetical protein